MSTESARKATEEILEYTGLELPRTRDGIQAIIEKHCSAPAPFLYCGAEHPTLKVGCILRLGHDKHENMGDTWESGAAPAVSTPPSSESEVMPTDPINVPQHGQIRESATSASLKTSGLAVSTPRCPRTRGEICEWTRGWFERRKVTREDFDLPSMLSDFAYQFFQAAPLPPQCAKHPLGKLPEGKGLWQVSHLGCGYPTDECTCYCGINCAPSPQGESK